MGFKIKIKKIGLETNKRDNFHISPPPKCNIKIVEGYHNYRMYANGF